MEGASLSGRVPVPQGRWRAIAWRRRWGGGSRGEAELGWLLGPDPAWVSRALFLGELCLRLPPETREGWSPGAPEAPFSWGLSPSLSLSFSISLSLLLPYPTQQHPPLSPSAYLPSTSAATLRSLEVPRRTATLADSAQARGSLSLGTEP